MTDTKPSELNLDELERYAETVCRCTDWIGDNATVDSLCRAVIPLIACVRELEAERLPWEVINFLRARANCGNPAARKLLAKYSTASKPGGGDGEAAAVQASLASINAAYGEGVFSDADAAEIARLRETTGVPTVPMKKVPMRAPPAPTPEVSEEDRKAARAYFRSLTLARSEAEIDHLAGFFSVERFAATAATRAGYRDELKKVLAPLEEKAKEANRVKSTLDARVKELEERQQRDYYICNGCGNLNVRRRGLVKPCEHCQSDGKPICLEV